MSTDNVVNQIREELNGRPGQAIVLGVCSTLAARYDREPWVFRLTAIVLTLFWSIPAIAAYVILGLVLSETEERTRGFFSGMSVIIRETVEKFLDGIQDLFGNDENSRSRRNGF